MGSSGSGRFSDYSGRPIASDGSGGSSGRDKCLLAFSAILEEVERCEYFRIHRSSPAVGSSVQLLFDVRPLIATEGGVVIGYLPTQYNYLVACLEAGHSYVGFVQRSTTSPLVNVVVDMQPA